MDIIFTHLGNYCNESVMPCYTLTVDIACVGIGTAFLVRIGIAIAYVYWHVRAKALPQIQNEGTGKMTKAQMLVVKEFGVKPEDVRVVGSDVLFSAGDSEVRVSRCGFAESEYVCPLCGELDRFCACGDEY